MEMLSIKGLMGALFFLLLLLLLVAWVVARAALVIEAMQDAADHHECGLHSVEYCRVHPEQSRQ